MPDGFPPFRESVYPLLPIGPQVASCSARIATAERERARRLRRHDTWIAATAMHHRAAVLTQDADFTTFEGVEVISA